MLGSFRSKYNPCIIANIFFSSISFQPCCFKNLTHIKPLSKVIFGCKTLVSNWHLGGVFGLYFYKENIFIKIFGSSIYYRLDRIFNWSAGSGLQLKNALAAIGSAGLFGHGFNNTPIYFPEASTDFIFAVFASNFGLVGVIVLLVIILFLDINIIILARKKIDDIDKYIISGIIGMLIFQQIQNIGMTIGLLPIMGITLPFVSYGGSSLLSYMLLVGILLNISQKKKRTYKY